MVLMKRRCSGGEKPMSSWAVLGSGSSGNSYLFTDGTVSVLIDQGFSVAELKRRLARFGTEVGSVEAVFVTHLHPDHARGVGTLARMHGVKAYIHSKAIKNQPALIAKIGVPEGLLEGVEPFEVIEVGPFSLYCFETSHDCDGSVGWIVSWEGEQCMVLTDTGTTTAVHQRLAFESTLLFLEANYDETMLANGPYPPFLQERIRGERGHLSNGEALDFLTQSGFQGHHVYFIHISDTNNRVELLSEAAKAVSPVPYTVCAKGQWYGMVGE